LVKEDKTGLTGGTALRITGLCPDGKETVQLSIGCNTKPEAFNVDGSVLR